MLQNQNYAKPKKLRNSILHSNLNVFVVFFKRSFPFRLTNHFLHSFGANYL